MMVIMIMAYEWKSSDMIRCIEKSYTKTEDSINHVQQNTERGLL